jgi:ribosomal subunit interface protein
MKIQITYKGFDKKDKKDLKKFIAEKASELEHKLGDLIRSDTCLRGTLEKHNKMPLVRLGLTLHLPKKDIAAEEEGEEIREIISKVFDELERQGQKYKSRLKNHHLWKRKARRKQLSYQLAEIASQQAEEPVKEQEKQQASNWFDGIRPHLDSLYDFAKREITYLQATGDLSPADILPDELIDETIVMAFENRNEKPENLSDKGWLFKLALDILDREIEKSQEQQQLTSLETVIPEEDIDTQIYEFYQPDEVLKLEDLIPVSSETPEQVSQQAEQRELHSSLSKLPRNWRRARILHDTVGFEPTEIATIMAMEISAIENLLSMAEQFIADQAQQTGRFVSFSVTATMQSVVKTDYAPELLSELEKKFKG